MRVAAFKQHLRLAAGSCNRDDEGGAPTFVAMTTKIRSRFANNAPCHSSRRSDYEREETYAWNPCQPPEGLTINCAVINETIGLSVMSVRRLVIVGHLAVILVPLNSNNNERELKLVNRTKLMNVHFQNMASTWALRPQLLIRPRTWAATAALIAIAESISMVPCQTRTWANYTVLRM